LVMGYPRELLTRLSKLRDCLGANITEPRM